MEESIEVQETQNIPEVSEPKTEQEVIFSPEEITDLKHRAEVSSQNFERAKKAEARLKELEDNNVLLKKEEPGDEETVKLKQQVVELTAKAAKAEIIEVHPVLKEAWSEFEQFRTESKYEGIDLDAAAEIFLAKKGLLSPQRKGLEKTTGGSKIPQSTGMTNEEIKKLRETDFRRYREMLKKGHLKV